MRFGTDSFPKINDAVYCEHNFCDSWGKEHRTAGIFRVFAVAAGGVGMIRTPAGVVALQNDRVWHVAGRYSRFPFVLFRRFIPRKR